MLRNIYFTKFQFLISFGIILWDGEKECKSIRNTKKNLHTIEGLHKRESCRPIFKELKVLTVTVSYIFEVFIYIKIKTCI